MGTNVSANSQIPSVRALVYSMPGKRFEYVTVNNAGQVIGYKLAGESLVIVVPRSTDNVADIFGTDRPGDILQRQSIQNSIYDLSFSQQRFDPRLMTFGLGLSVLVMAMLYSKKRR